jgi:hypothetical protein
VQADAHNQLALPDVAPPLDRVEWGKDPYLKSGLDHMLDRIQYLAMNGLTSLMVLHDLISKHLTPLQDHPRLAWMYTGVNDIMQLDRGLGLSLDKGLLAACLKALTSDQFLAELMASPAAYEPICMNQVARTALLMVMPTLDNVDITAVQRGDLSCGMVIPGTNVSGGLGGATSSRGSIVIGGQGGSPAGGGPTGNRGTGATVGSGPAPALGKGKKK